MSHNQNSHSPGFTRAIDYLSPQNTYVTLNYEIAKRERLIKQHPSEQAIRDLLTDTILIQWYINQRAALLQLHQTTLSRWGAA